MVKVYLNTLKTQGKYTYTDISNLSGIPEATIKKYFLAKPLTQDLIQSQSS